MTSEEKSAKTFDRDFFVRMGKRGGDLVKETREANYYSKIGKKGGKKRWNKSAPSHAKQVEDQNS